MFTSLNDDSAGGDTNSDGDASVPAAGYWRGIVASGNGGILDHHGTLVLSPQAKS